MQLAQCVAEVIGPCVPEYERKSTAVLFWPAIDVSTLAAMTARTTSATREDRGGFRLPERLGCGAAPANG